MNKAYASTGLQILMNALKRQPLLFALGFGGHAEALAIMLRKLGWTFETVPFFFLVHHPFRFLRNISLLRSTGAKRALADLLACSGLGWIGIKLANLLLRRKSPNVPPPKAEVVEVFSSWVDELWDVCKQDYAMCAVRDM